MTVSKSVEKAVEPASEYGRIWLHLNGDVGTMRSRVCGLVQCGKTEVVLVTETYWYLI